VARGGLHGGALRSVLADNSWEAIQGRKALSSTWDEGPGASELPLRCAAVSLTTPQPGKVFAMTAIAAARASNCSVKTVEALYEVPFADITPQETMKLHRRNQARRRGEAWIPTARPQWPQGVHRRRFQIL